MCVWCGGRECDVDVDVDIDVVVTWAFFVDHQRIFEIWSRIGHAIKNTKKWGTFHLPFGAWVWMRVNFSLSLFRLMFDVCLLCISNVRHRIRNTKMSFISDRVYLSTHIHFVHIWTFHAKFRQQTVCTVHTHTLSISFILQFSFLFLFVSSCKDQSRFVWDTPCSFLISFFGKKYFTQMVNWSGEAKRVRRAWSRFYNCKFWTSACGIWI